MSVQIFRSKLLSWYDEHKRDLPWRGSQDPYPIWLSEIILQQTRVAQGLSYFQKFMKNFPNVSLLANAKEEEVLKLWQGLGYYSRARNLHTAAKQIDADGFPEDYKGLLELKGVGEYTAAAIASIAYNEAVPVVDGNVFRVLSRFYGLDTPIDTTQGKKEFRHLAEESLFQADPGKWNQALMEFGALQCIPKSPNCELCPVMELCYARNHQKVGELPVKQGKVKTKTLYLNFFFFQESGHSYIIKRPQNGIWGGLYEFPNLESEKQLNAAELRKLVASTWGLHAEDYVWKSTTQSLKHVLSHRIFHAKFHEVSLHQALEYKNWERIKLGNIHKYPVSRLVEKYIDGEIPTDING